MCPISRSVPGKFVAGFLSCVGLLSAGAAIGQQQKASPATKVPQITAIFPAGGERGTTGKFEITGKNLNSVTDLYFSPSIGTVESLDASGADRLVATVAIHKDIDPGAVEVRAISSDGLSNLKLLRIDELPDVNETTGRNDTPDQAQPIDLPTVVNGRLTAADIDCYQIRVAQGQRVVFEVEARRLGSPVEARLRLLDRNGRLIADASTTRAIRPDERLDYEFKEAGEYVVAVEDAQYVGGDNAVYRLRVGSWPYATAQFPLGGRRGQNVELALQGGNLAEPMNYTVTLPSAPDATFVRLQFATDHGTLFAPMLVVVGDETELVEHEPNDDAKEPQRIASPCTVNGRIERAGDKDRFVLKAKKGEKLVVEVFANRLGSWLDSVLTIADKNGRMIVENDDLRQGNAQQNQQAKTGVTPISDSRVEFTAPSDGDFTITIDDRYHGGGAEFAYRLVLTPGQPDFQLAYGPAPPAKNQPQRKQAPTAPTDVANLEPGGSATVSVAVTRRGFDGEIELGIEGLPDGVTFEAGKIPAKQAAGQLTLKADAGAISSMSRARVVGRAKINDQDVRRYAQNEIVVAQIDPLHTARIEMSDIALAVLRRDAPLALRVAGEAVMTRGAETEIKVGIERKAGFKGPVELKVDKLPKGVTAQNVTIAQDQSEVVVKLSSTANAATGTQKIQIHSQAKLGAATVEAAIELSLAIVSPFEVTFESTEKELELVAGETCPLRVGIKRRGNFEGPIELAVTGLPPGVTVTPDKVEPDQHEIVLNFVASMDVLPNQSKKQIKIQATGEIGNEKVQIESEAIALSVKQSP
jgi:hypothetical protein